MKYVVWLLVLVFCIVSAMPARAQQSVDARIDRLERELQTLQVQLFRESKEPSRPLFGRDRAAAPSSSGRPLPQDSAERLQVQISELQEELQSLTGRVEELTFQTTQFQERLDKLVADIDRRLLDLERRSRGEQPLAGAPAPAQSSGPPPAPVAPPPAPSAVPADTTRSLGTLPAGTSPTTIMLPEGTPQQQYDYAFNFLKNSEFANAEDALRAFLQKYPSHELSANAQYWLAETYFVREDYSNAAVQFLEGYQKYPKSSKAADNLLKLALSLSKVGSTREACTTLGKLAKEFPEAPGNIKRRGAAEWEQLRCGAQSSG